MPATIAPTSAHPEATRARPTGPVEEPLRVEVVVRGVGSGRRRIVGSLSLEGGRLSDVRTGDDPAFDELLTIAMLHRGTRKPRSKPWVETASIQNTPLRELALPSEILASLEQAQVRAVADLYEQSQRALEQAAELSRRQVSEVHSALAAYVSEVLTRSTESLTRRLTEALSAPADGDDEQVWWPGDELATARDAILRFGGTTPLSLEQVLERLHVTRQAVSQRRRSGRLLGLPLGPRKWVYPAWQFSSLAPDQLLPGLRQVLSVAPRSDPWATAQLLTSRQEPLDDEIPLLALRRSNGAHDVVERIAELFIDRFGDGGVHG